MVGLMSRLLPLNPSLSTRKAQIPKSQHAAVRQARDGNMQHDTRNSTIGVLEAYESPTDSQQSEGSTEIAVVTGDLIGDFQQSSIVQGLSRFLAHVSYEENKLCRTLSSLCDGSYALQRGWSELYDSEFHFKYGFSLVATSEERTHVEYEADMSPTEVMNQGDGMSATYESLLFSRFAHQILDGEEAVEPLAATPAPEAVDSNARECTASGWEAHQQAIDRLGERMQSSAVLREAPREPSDAEHDWSPGEARSVHVNDGSCQGWLVFDSQDKATRLFVIQGSIGLDSWMVNLSLEPVDLFEADLGVKVHRGMYELAEVLYSRFLHLVQDHLATQPDGKICFAGHSLGGGLSQVLLLMYVFRGVLQPRNIEGVFSFGTPAIFCEQICGQNSIFETLGLPRSAFRNVIMDRDITPRLFSCNFRTVKDFVRTWGQNFWTHRYLTRQLARPCLYSFLGDVLVLVPHAEQAHVQEGYLPSLPQQPGLWRVVDDESQGDGQGRQWAIDYLMDHPHPWEIMRNPASYGGSGAISRFHDSGSYVKSLSAVLLHRKGQLSYADLVALSFDEDDTCSTMSSIDCGVMLEAASFLP